MDDKGVLERALQRERRARHEAESILEAKSAEQHQLRQRVGELAEYIAVLEDSASDSVTGLLNRRALIGEVNTSLALSSSAELVAISIDINRFSRVNEALGRTQADDVLALVGERLRSRSQEIRAASSEGGVAAVGRMSGDEFIIILGGGNVIDDVETHVMSLLSSVAEPIDIGGQQISLDAQAGYAVSVEPVHDVENLLDRAGDALVRVKGSPGLSYAEHPGHAQAESAISSEIVLEQRIREGLARGEFEAFFQPRVDLRSGSIVAGEALLRWRQPDGSLVFPGGFIEVAEQSTLIRELGDVALCGAIALSRRLAKHGVSLPLSINLAARQLAWSGLVEHLLREIQEGGVPVRLIELEITESLVVEQYQAMEAMVRLLSEHGFRIGLDDFGKGHSSLSRLLRLPIDVIKLDKGFADGLARDERAVDVITAICRLSEALKANLVIEGIETLQQLDLLKGLPQCEVQGFVYSAAVTAEEFVDLVTEQPWRIA